MTGAKKFHDELYLIDYVAVKCHGKSQRAINEKENNLKTVT
jgi:hypothetical protein